MKNIFPYLILSILLYAFASCEKDNEITPTTNPNAGGADTTFVLVEGITVGDLVIRNLTENEVTLKASISKFSAKTFSVPQHGFYISKTNNPNNTNHDRKSELGSLNSVGQITSRIQNLESNTTYYARFYLIKKDNTTGNTSVGLDEKVISFKTNGGVPFVTITDINLLNNGNSYSVQAEIGDFYGQSANRHGFIIKEGTNTNISLSSADETIDLGNLSVASSHTFSHNFSNLESGKQYTIKAFATNSTGEGYSNSQTIRGRVDFSEYDVPTDVFNILFKDEFDENTIWYEGRGEITGAYYNISSGYYRISAANDRGASICRNLTNNSLNNYQYEVDINLRDSAPNSCGIRWEGGIEDRCGYRLAINENKFVYLGYFDYLPNIDEYEWNSFLPPSFKENSIRTDRDDYNTITIRRIGSFMYIFINKKLIAEVEHDLYRGQTEFGMEVSADCEARFDNMKLYEIQ